MKKFNFNPLNSNDFKKYLGETLAHGKRFDSSVQFLALDAMYQALVSNDSRKADQVLNALRGSDKRLFTNYVIAHSNLRVADADYKKEYQLLREKPFPKERTFYACNKESKVLDAKNPDNIESARIAMANEKLALASEILWSDYKAPKNSEVKPINIIAALDRLEKRDSSDSWGFSDEDDKKAFEAFKSYKGLISQGYDLETLKNQLRKEIRNEMLVSSGELNPVTYKDEVEKSA